MLAILLNVGHSAEPIEPGKAYRISGDASKLLAIAGQIGPDDGVALEVEAATDDQVVLTTSLAPQRPHRRSVYVQGAGLGQTLVARAVDAGLWVEAAGKSRWRVNGATASLMNWLALHAHAATLEETLATWGLTAEQAAAEDASDTTPPAVKVILPERRRTTTEIKRDAEGYITGVTQEEQDVHDEQVDG
jgi:hypothetical protein